MKLISDVVIEQRQAIQEAEKALGENLVWLTDKLDLQVRQKDAETLRRLKQLNEAWKGLVHASQLR